MTGHFDLVILCHSLAGRERELIAANVRSWNPTALVVLVDRHPGQVEDGMDAVLSGAPNRLVKELPLLLGNQLAAIR